MSPDVQMPRRPHTVYLTQELWDALDRLYLQSRLEGSATSKIELIERVLNAGIKAIGADDRNPETRPPKHISQPKRTQTKPTRRRATNQPKPKAVSPPGSTARRGSALERLKLASDPGRPTTIASAARSPE